MKIKHWAIGILTVLLISGGLWTILTTRACAVEIDGRTVAVAKNRATAEAVLDSLIREEEARLGTAVWPAQDTDYKMLWDKPSGEMDEDELRSLMADNLTFETAATEIRVDGRPAAVVRDEAAAEYVLKLVREAYQIGPHYDTAFEEELDLVPVVVPTHQVLPVVEAVRRLKGEGEQPMIIARAFDGPADAETPPDAGARLMIRETPEEIASPLVTVVARAEETAREEIPFERQVRENRDMLYGRTRVVQQGENGLREVEYRIVAVNGVEAEREVLDTRTITEPRPEIMERGSARVVNSVRLVIPGGRISSPFGWRWGRMHQGIDVALAHGTPVRAAGDGTVTYAGWYGGYGNMVEISHGNGVTTRYGHQSAINVSEGDRVQMGNTIGRVGSTGVSTGPHLHFEIRIYGEAVNPIP